MFWNIERISDFIRVYQSKSEYIRVYKILSDFDSKSTHLSWWRQPRWEVNQCRCIRETGRWANLGRADAPSHPWLSPLIWMIFGCLLGHLHFVYETEINWDMPATTNPGSWMVLGLFRSIEVYCKQQHVFRTDSMATTLHICSRITHYKKNLDVYRLDLFLLHSCGSHTFSCRSQMLPYHVSALLVPFPHLSPSTRFFTKWQPGVVMSSTSGNCRQLPGTVRRNPVDSLASFDQRGE